MNRIELVALFTSLKSHAEKNDIESIKEIVYAVLEEAQYAKRSERETNNRQDD